MKTDRKQFFLIILGAVLIFMVFVSGMFMRQNIPLEDMTTTGGMYSDCEITNGDRGVVMYGPYLSLKKGSYKVRFNYDAESENNVRVTLFKGGGTIAEGTLPADKKSADIEFTLPCDMLDSGVEFVVDYSGQGRLKINSITLSNNRIYLSEMLLLILFIAISVCFVRFSKVGHKEWYILFYIAMNILLGAVMTENVFFMILLSLLVIFFAFLDRKLVLNSEKALVYTAIIAFAYAIMIFCTKSSPLYIQNDWVDTQSYYTMGKGIFNGKAIYRELFEQKGPLFYLMYGIGYLINTHNLHGEYFLEGLGCALTLIFTYKIARMYLSKNMSFLAVCALPVIIYNGSFMRYGGTCEEFMTPFIMMSFYNFLCIFKEGRQDRKYMFANGMLGGCILMMKFNVTLFFVGMGACVFLMNIADKDYKLLVENIVATLIGALVVIVPVFMWLAMSGSVGAFYEVVSFNSKYSPIKLDINGIHITIRNIINSWNGNWFCTAVMLLGLSSFVFVRKFINKWGALGLVLSFVCMNYGVFASASQAYYYMVLCGFTAFGIISFLYMLENQKITAERCAVSAIAVMSVVLTVHYNNNFRETKPFIEYVSAQDKFAMIMKSKTDEPTLLNYGFLDGGFYTAADIVPNVRFFQKQNISDSDYPLNISTQRDAMRNKDVQFVVVRRNSDAGEDTTPALVDNYNIISRQQQRFEGIDFTYYLYEAK